MKNQSNSALTEAGVVKVAPAVGDVFLVPSDGHHSNPARYYKWRVHDIQHGDEPLLFVEPTYASALWMRASEFQNMRPVKYGHYEKRGWWFFEHEVLVRE